MTLDREMSLIWRQLDGLEAWVVPMALGLRPAQYAEMREVLGEVIWLDEGKWQVRRYGQPPDHDAARRSLDTLAQVVIRLWLTGSLYRGSRSEAAEARRACRRGRPKPEQTRDATAR